jgi:hypothetical protein
VRTSENILDRNRFVGLRGDMLKLYRTTGDKREYWEAWENDRTITVHWGDLGERGETRELPLKGREDSSKAIEREAEPARAEGFRSIAEGELARVVIQYRVDGMGTTKDLNLRYKVENLMNEGLGWTGLGHCDGGDIGSGTINVFCFVVDVAVGERVIVRDLEENKLLEQATIAHMTEEGDRVLWPKNFVGDFSLMDRI